jgi:hypothetical protein
MKKVLIVGLLVVVLALGTMGTAFATGMNFSGPDAVMSEGSTSIVQANVDSIRFQSAVDWNSVYSNNPEITEVVATGVVVSFDINLKKGTTLGFSVLDGGNDIDIGLNNTQFNCAGVYTLQNDLPAAQETTIPFDGNQYMKWSPDIIAADSIVVRVIGGTPQ